MCPPVNALDFSKMPEMYERWLVGPLFRPWVDDMLESAGLGPGERLLDVVTCHQGLQFFPDKPAAVRETRRALAPGGGQPWPHGAPTRKPRSFGT